MRQPRPDYTVCRREPAPGQFRHPGQGDLFLTPCRLADAAALRAEAQRLRAVARGITDEKALTAIHQLVEELEERAREAEFDAERTGERPPQGDESGGASPIPKGFLRAPSRK
jgi:hypothetical protein